MIKIKSFVFNPFAENTFVVYDETKQAIIIDPGCYEVSEQETLKTFIESEELKVVKLVNTHCHVDHVLGNHFVKTTFGVPLVMHESDLQTLQSVEVYAPNYGFNNYKSVKPDVFVFDGEFVTFGNTKLIVLFVPGHAPGHIALYCKDTKQVINGDVLFRQSIGRTDLPGGDFDTLINSIKTKMFALPDETVVYTGHGEPTTIGFEKANNPFIR
ncbi:MAG: MBL fold metallo-hydrolase [Bacteroidota bacterium]